MGVPWLLPGLLCLASLLASVAVFASRMSRLSLQEVRAAAAAENQVANTAPRPTNQSIVFIQYQAPPALSRTASGEWVATDRFLCQSLLTAAHHGVAPVVLGPVDRSLTDPKAGKAAALTEYLRQGVVPDNTPVIFYDTDVLLLNDLPTLQRAVGSFALGRSILFSAERNCWPIFFPHYPRAPTSFRYVNTGGFLALAGPHLLAFAEAWQRCIADRVDDQTCVHWFYLRDRGGRPYWDGEGFDIQLDTQCAVFQSAYQTALQFGLNHTSPVPPPLGLLWPSPALFSYWPLMRSIHMDKGKPWLVDGKVVNPETNTHPSLLHFNGDRRPMETFLAAKFPHLAWDAPRVRRQQFTIWGYRVTGSSLCNVPITPPSSSPALLGQAAALATVVALSLAPWAAVHLWHQHRTPHPHSPPHS
eukprot:EG_transcript_14196